MRNYKQLSHAQRHQIEVLNKAGKKPERDSGAARRIANRDLPGMEGE